MGLKKVFWDCGAVGLALQPSSFPGDPLLSLVKNPRPVQGALGAGVGRSTCQAMGRGGCEAVVEGHVLSMHKPCWTGA